MHGRDAIQVGVGMREDIGNGSNELIELINSIKNEHKSAGKKWA